MSLTNFVPQVWSSRLLVNLRTNIVAADISNTDYEGDIAGLGSAVKINAIGAVTIGAYTSNADMSAPEVLTSSQKILTIDQAKFFNFAVDDVDAAQMTPKIMDGAMAEAAYGLARTADSYVLATSVAGAGTALAVSAFAGSVTKAYEYLVDLNTTLDNNNTPNIDRWAVVTPAFYGILLKDARFIRATQQGDRVLNTGLVGEAAGLTIYKSNQIAAGTVLAGYKGAISFADQVNSVEAYRPQLRFADAVKGLHLYGFSVVRPTALVSGTWTA